MNEKQQAIHDGIEYHMNKYILKILAIFIASIITILVVTGFAATKGTLLAIIGFISSIVICSAIGWRSLLWQHPLAILKRNIDDK